MLCKGKILAMCSKRNKPKEIGITKALGSEEQVKLIKHSSAVPNSANSKLGLNIIWKYILKGHSNLVLYFYNDGGTRRDISMKRIVKISTAVSEISRHWPLVWIFSHPTLPIMQPMALASKLVLGNSNLAFHCMSRSSSAAWVWPWDAVKTLQKKQASYSCHIFWQTSDSILLNMRIFQIPHLHIETEDFWWKMCHISGVLLWYQCKQHMVCYFTSPGSRAPAEGAMLMSESLGGRKENSLGATRVMASLVSVLIGCLDWLWLVSRLIRKMMVVEWSPTAVAPNWTRECESSNGGRTTTARQVRWKSLMTKKNKLFSSILYKYIWDLALIEPDIIINIWDILAY